MKSIFRNFFVFFWILNSSILYSQSGDYPIVDNGKLIKNGKEYRAVGVNYYDAFYRLLKNNNDTSYKKGFKQLSKFKIPFVRINGGGYFAKDWTLYLTNKQKYFNLLDKVIREAEEQKIGIVFSFFWRYTSIPKYMKESINAYGNLNSKTISFIKEYTEEIVKRYSKSPAIWGWEFGNEYNLKINLEPQNLHSFFIEKSEWNDENILKIKDLIIAFKIFKNIIRSHDTKRFISSGNGLSRLFIYHKVKTINIDNVENRLYNVISNENLPFDSLSIHLYPWALNERFFYKYFNYDINTFLNFLSRIAMKRKQIIYIGEFGFFKIKDKKKRKILMNEYLKAFSDSNISLASIWVYNRREDRKANINVDILKKIMLYNKAILKQNNLNRYWLLTPVITGVLY